MPSLRIAVLASVSVLLVAPAALAGYAGAVLGDSPVSYWRLNENGGATTADDEQNSFDGTYQNNVSPGSAGPRPSDGFAGFGSTNQAPDFPSGGDDYVSTELGQSAVGGDYPFTLEAWVKTSETFGSRNFLTISDESAGNQLWGLGMKDFGSAGSPDYQIRAFSYNGSFEQVRTDRATSYNDGEWHYVAAVFVSRSGGVNQDAEMRLFVDPAGTTPNNTLVHGQDFAGAGANGTNIGALVRNKDKEDVDSVQAEWGGQIDEAAVYNAELSGAQSKSHFDAAVVPEPASIALLAPAGLLMLRRRRCAA